MIRKETFSLRKYKIGTVSVLLGAVFLFGGGPVVSADDSQAVTHVVQTNQEATASPEGTLIPEESLATELNPAAGVTTTPPPLLESDSVESSSESIPNSVFETSNRQEPSTVQLVSAEVTGVENQAAQPVISHQQSSTDSSSVLVNGSEQTTIPQAEPSTSKDKKGAQPQNIDSNTMITVPSVWNSGYKGEGKVVAIIDSGLDIDHDALRISDMSKAKYKTSEEIEAAKQAAGINYGQWYSDKVVFGYNYVDVNTTLKEKEKASHGMHVTGIAAGNPTKPSAGELIYGVAPEAQVMFMRVFSDIQPTTGPALYVRAIEDAVKLGADSINLSLGGANGSVVNMDDTVTAAIELARKAGVTVTISAGNDGTFGSGHSEPLAENPDYGLVSTPSTARDAISVASFNNSTLATKVINILGLEDNAELNHGRSSFSNPEKSDKTFEEGKVYDYVFAGLGQSTDFDGLDLTGKLALIKRGEITFTEKIANAAAAGALGVVIYNNRPGEANLNMSLEEPGLAIPSIFIPYEFGEALAAKSYQIQFNNEAVKEDNPAAGILSDFSSWGLSADGELKPDLAAPGGSIYSAINDNDYGNMSGTSMAAPHVAGAAVLVKQYLEKTYPDKTPQELEALVKNLLMSTAQPHFNPDTVAYTSPRQQGAGLIDIAAAISRGLYLTGEDGYSSLSLGNVEDSFSFDVTVHNISNQDRTLNYVTHLNTDGVADGLFTLAPRELTTIPGGSVTVKANSSTTVRVTVDASQFREELSQLMKNGYYLEGFVRFTDPTDGGDVVSIPYVGFRGQFQNLPVVEESIYKLLADGKGGFYFEPVENQPLALGESQHYTGLVTGSTEQIYSTDERTDFAIKTLGTFKDEAGNFVLHLDQNGQPRLAISPNGDSNQDSLAFKGVFLRNYSHLVASVYAADDSEQANPLWTSKPKDGIKNFYSDNPDREKSSIIYPTEWAGTDQKGKDLPDGRYKYVLTYMSEVPGAKTQTMTFDVIVDRQAPAITTATYDETTFRFAPRPAQEQGDAGILREQVFYLVADESGATTLVSLTDNGGAKVEDNKVLVAQNTDGSFTLPLDLADLSKFYYTVEDFAGNVTYAKVADLVSIGNDKGLVTVNLLNKETDKPAPVDFTYAVRDEAGNIVAELPRYAEDKATLKLPFGTYTFELFLYDKEWSSPTGETTVVKTISAENSKETVNFYVLVKDKASLLLDVDQALPAGTKVQVVTADGQAVSLPQAKYSKTDYGRLVPVGDYQVVANLPEGYEFLEEDLSVSVVTDKATVKTLTLLNKVALNAFLADVKGLEENPLYYNADQSLQTAYDQALAAATAIAKEKQPQAMIDAVLAKLQEVKIALNGQATDLSQLLTEIESYGVTKSSPAYYNASGESQVAYDTQLRVAQLVLNKDKVSQVEVDQALTDLLSAKAGLDGQTTDRTALRNAVGVSSLLRATSAKYLNASEPVKTSYDQAVEAAQALLVAEEVTQEEVDQALATLTAAQAKLDGVDTPTVSDKITQGREQDDVQPSQPSPPSPPSQSNLENDITPLPREEQSVKPNTSTTDSRRLMEQPSNLVNLVESTSLQAGSGLGLSQQSLSLSEKQASFSKILRESEQTVSRENDSSVRLPETGERSAGILLLLGLVTSLISLFSLKKLRN